MKTYNFNNTYSYAEILENINDLEKNGLFEGYKISIPEFNDVIRFDKRMLATITGVPNRGKSEFVDWLTVELNKAHKFKTLFFSAEDTLKIHTKKLLDKYNFAKTVSNANKAKYLYNNFGFIDYDKVYTIEDLFAVAENEIRAKNYDILVIDPFNKLEAQKEYNVNMTDYISKFLDRLLRFTKQFNIITFLVAHPRKQINTDIIPTAYDIADSAHFFNKSDYCLSVHADKVNLSTTIKIDKVKYKHLGDTTSITLNYDDKTGNFYYFDDTAPIYDTSNYTYNIPTYSIPEFTPSITDNDANDLLDITVDWFSNIKDTTPKERNLKQILTSNSYLNEITKLENLHNMTYGTAEYKEYKTNLGNFAINARFNNSRNKENVRERTGLLYIDIDFKDNKDIINDIPKLLKTNSNVLFFKRSCSLKGYFAIIPYSLTLSFDSVWNAINEDFKQIGINIDKGTKNIDRVTFYSNDTEYFINENVEIYNKSLDITKSVSKTQNYKTPYKTNKIVSSGSNNSSNTNYLLNLIKWLDASNISLETNYNEWQQIAMALISEFKDDGLNYFLELSKNDKEYNEIDATEFYNDHLSRYEDNNAVTFGTIKHLAKQRGYDVF